MAKQTIHHPKDLARIEGNLPTCPWCKTPAALRQSRGSGLYYVECSNTIDCLMWPMTNDHESPEKAAEDWNNSKTY